MLKRRCTCYACTGYGPVPLGKYLDLCAAGWEWYAYYDGILILIRAESVAAARDLDAHVYQHLQLLARLAPAKPRFKRLPAVDRVQLVIPHPAWRHRLARAGYRQLAA